MVFAWDQGMGRNSTYEYISSDDLQVVCHPAILVSQSSHFSALPAPSEYTRTSSPARPRSLPLFVYVDE